MHLMGGLFLIKLAL